MHGTQPKGQQSTAVVQQTEQHAQQPSSEAIIQERTNEADPEVAKDSPDGRIRFEEKKRLDWAGKTCEHLELHLWIISISYRYIRFGTSDDRWELGTHSYFPRHAR